MYDGDGTVPAEALPPLDHAGENALGRLVLIPAAKYKRWATAKFPPRGDKEFLGWIGMIVEYADKQHKKAKVKVHGDSGFETLNVTGASAYAVDKLVRLM